MTPRKRRLVRYGIGISVLVAAITLLVWGVEVAQQPADPTLGIDDILRRDLPADTPRVGFVDATASAGIAFRHFTGTRTHVLPEDMGSGLAWGDCDGDGSADLYLVSFVAPVGTGEQAMKELPGNALYRNRGDGSFESIGRDSGADLKGFGLGASWADYDGDADLDLYVTNYGSNRLLRNDGSCRFVDVTEGAGVGGEGDDFSAGSSWGDYDGDGDLDLYVTNYVRFDATEAPDAGSSMQFDMAVPFTLNPASYEPAPNRLYRNDGGEFTEVALQAGVDNVAGRSLSAAWCDFDQDGDLDLYVANDVSDNAMFENQGDGSFLDVSTESLTADYRGAMGMALTDFDHDGDIDFFVTHWIAQENGLYRNHLEVGTDRLFFADVAEMMGLGYTALQYVGWGTAFVDYDNDGRKDLFVANGHTLEDVADTTRLLPQKMQLFWNRGPEGFFDVTAVAGPPFGRLLVARGAAAADYDRDGNVDLAVLENGGSVLLLRNAGGSGAHWLQIDLRQTGANRFALGGQVEIEASGQRQTDVVGVSPSYLSQNDLRLHFGLGDATRVDAVTVRWPDGALERWRDLAADHIVTLRRGTGTAPDTSSPAAETGPDGRPEVRFWEHFRAARKAGREGDAVAAISRFKQALQIDPDHRDALYYLGQLLYRRGELRDAAVHLEHLAAIEPRALRPWQQLSVLRGQPMAGFEVNLDAATEAAQRALALNPAESRNHLLLARWAAYQGETDVALASLQTALGYNPQLWEAYLLRLWLEPDAAASIQQQVIEQLCEGDEGRGPACPSHAALHVALAAALGPAATAPLIGPAEVGTSGGALTAREIQVRGLLSSSLPEAARWSLPAESGSASGGTVWDFAGSNPVLVRGSGNGAAVLPRSGVSGSRVIQRPVNTGNAVGIQSQAPSAVVEATEVAAPGWLRGAPWRAATVRLPPDRGLVVVGGAGVDVLYFNNQDGSWAASPSEGIPKLLSGAVATAADFDGDGVDELFLANVAFTPDGSETGGVLLTALGGGRFAPAGMRVPGPLSAALAADLDGDGDPDLLVARPPPPKAMASYLRPRPDASPPPKTEPVVSLWRNHDGTLVEEADALPVAWARVQDITVGDFDADGDADIYLATGSLAPEVPEPDLLWLQQGGRFVDATTGLGIARFGSSLRAWTHPDGGIVVLRGGLVPADPQRLLWFTLDRKIRGH